MTETTPDYARLIAEAEAAQEWMLQPDWADNFSLDDMVDWLRQRPTSILPKLTTALRALLERYEALERERDELLEELGRVIMACPMSPEMRTRPADVGVKALRADRDRLEARVKELERERNEARRQSDRFCDKYLAALSRAEAAEAERDRLKERVAELEKALEPFAREAEDWSPEANDGLVFEDAESIAGETSITVGHLRTARAYRDKGRW